MSGKFEPLDINGYKPLEPSELAEFANQLRQRGVIDLHRQGQLMATAQWLLNLHSEASGARTVIWALAREAGGQVSVSQATMQDANPLQANLHMAQSPDALRLVFTAETGRKPS